MFKDKYGPWALVIGGSEGIGAAFATRLAKQGLKLAITARKVAPLEATAAKLRSEFKIDVTTLSLDMTAPDMMEKIAAFTKDMDVGLVIYNAGAMDRVTTFLGDNVEGHLHTIKLNCEGPARIAHHFGNLMKTKRRGGIILMSSASALCGSYGVPVYGATKAYDMILAEGLWYEFKQFGVSVLGSVIGNVRTPSHVRLLGSEEIGGADPDDIARETLDNIENGPTLFAAGLQQMLPLVRDLDRRKAVLAFGEAGKSFFPPETNKRPFDPKAAVR